MRGTDILSLSKPVERDGGRGSPGEHGAEGVRETGEERQERAGISTTAGSGREIQKGKRLLLFLLLRIHSKT